VNGATLLSVSWNGDTKTSYWRVLGGASASALEPLTTVPRRGFETTIAVKEAPAVIAVEALDAVHALLATSASIGSF
jgi:hypothetical protein